MFSTIIIIFLDVDDKVFFELNLCIEIKIKKKHFLKSVFTLIKIQAFSLYSVHQLTYQVF